MTKKSTKMLDQIEDQIEDVIDEPTEIELPHNSFLPPGVKSTRKRERSTIEKPEVQEGCTVFDYVVAANVERRMLDIALAKGECPNSLKRDAEQEIRIEWSLRKADLKMKPSQVLAYASLMAHHTVLRVRRELGGPTRLPGSAFRKRSDGTTYVGIGALAPSLSVDEVESWYEFTDGHLDPDFARDYLPARDGNPEELHDAWIHGETAVADYGGNLGAMSPDVKACGDLMEKGLSLEQICEKLGYAPEIVQALASNYMKARRAVVVTEAFDLMRSENLTLEEVAARFNEDADWLGNEIQLLAEGIAIESMQQANEREILRKRREMLNKTRDVFKNEDVMHAVELLVNGVRLPDIYKTLGIAVKHREDFNKEVMEYAKRMRKSANQQKQRSAGE